MLRAAERLFIDQGIRQTTVAEIVEAAGVSIGAFYQRFENKDSIIHTIFYLLEDEIDEMNEALDLSAQNSLEDTVELIVSSSVEFYARKRGILLALLLTVQENPDIRRYVGDLRARIANVYVQALSPYKSEIGSRRFKTATAMSLRVLNSYTDQYLLWAEHDSADAFLKFEVSHRELVQVLLKYLKAD